jgi:hypothetical protein
LGKLLDKINMNTFRYQTILLCIATMVVFGLSVPGQAQVTLPATTDLIPIVPTDQELIDGQLRIQSTNSAPDGGRFSFQIESDDPGTLARYQNEFTVYSGGITGTDKTELGAVTFEPDSNAPETTLVATLLVGESAEEEADLRSQLDNLSTVVLWSDTAQLGLLAAVNEALSPQESTSPLTTHYCTGQQGKGTVQAIIHADPHPGNTRLVLQSQNLAPGNYSIISQPNSSPLTLGSFRSVRYKGARTNYDRKFYGNKTVKEEFFLSHLHDISLNALREKAAPSKKTKKVKKVGAFKAANTPEAISQLNLLPTKRGKKATPVLSYIAEIGRSVDLALQNKRGKLIPLTCSENSGSQILVFKSFSGEHNGRDYSGYIAISSLVGGKPQFDTTPLLMEARLVGLSNTRLAFFPTNGETGSAYAFEELEDMTGDNQSVWEFQVTNVPSMFDTGTGAARAEHSLLLPMTVFLITSSGQSLRLFDLNS